MTRRYLIIRNPASGGAGKGVTRAVVAALGGLGVETEIVDTEPGTGTRLAREGLARGFDAIIVAGGDGSIREAAKSLLGSGMPLGIIPVGTGNSLAREVNMGPAHSPAALAGVLAAAHTTRFYPGIVSLDGRDEIFLEEVSAGIDASAVHDVTPRLKRIFGPLAYVLTCVKRFVQGPNAAMVVEVGGRPIPAGWLIVARAEHYAGWLQLGSGATLTGAELMLMIVRHSNRREYLGYLWAMLRGRFASSDGVTLIAASEARITADKDLPVQVPVQADGDLMGHTPFSIRLSDQPIDLITPVQM